MKLLKRLFMEEEGVTMIEYVLIAALIAIAAVTLTGLAGEAVVGVWQDIVDGLEGN